MIVFGAVYETLVAVMGYRKKAGDASAEQAPPPSPIEVEAPAPAPAPAKKRKRKKKIEKPTDDVDTFDASAWSK